MNNDNEGILALTEVLSSRINVDDFESFEPTRENLRKLEVIKNLFADLLLEKKLSVFFESYEQSWSDIYIVSYPKSGTTLMQVILHSLVTGNNLEFDHIDEVSPWLAALVENNRKIPDRNPRYIFKSHDRHKVFRNIRKGKFIFLIRNGLDVINSLFFHVKNYHDPLIKFDELISNRLEGWFTFNESWLRNDNEIDILYLKYEDLLLDKVKSINRISDFLDLSPSDNQINGILDISSFENMKKHETKFRIKEPLQDNFSFIREGKNGMGEKKFPTEMYKWYLELGEKFLSRHELTKDYF